MKIIVKKYILLFLAIHFISCGLLTREVAKLPFLFTHYYEHKEINKNLNFIDFLKIHYVSNLKVDPQLPFHIEQYSFFSQFLFFVKNIFPIALHTIYENIERVEWFNINVL
ncbi:MAG: hypothetical protein ACRC0A_00515, partial [Chitinophagaceae bacterium]